ncbi:universal stress protein [Mycolicibacterium aromaticivorans]|uniref:universal stress protein n=1 Tax=Mycolicibacterium aromaticivorans TaxID=318425 RepID=UPI000448629C|nr:universal stress protein [Mycolicibacterium aromaticivorans]
MATIVVGIDGSPASVKALRWAVEEARLRGATVRAVYAWSFPFRDGEIAHLAAEAAHDALQQEAEQSAQNAVRQALGADADAIECVVTEDSPAQALTQAARDADLLVVGSRGRGGFAGLLLGSVSSQCAQHAPCPVVIVRP